MAGLKLWSMLWQSVRRFGQPVRIFTLSHTHKIAHTLPRFVVFHWERVDV